MIADLKPYSAMKDSGVEWLGDVPEHWGVRRLQTVSGMRVSNVDKHTKEDEVPVRLCNYVDVYKNDRIRASMGFMKATATSAEIDRFRLEVGDVLITKDSESWNDIGVPALVAEAAPDLISGYHLALLRPFDGILSGGFLFRLLESAAIAYQFHVEAKGVTRYGLSHSAIKAVWMSLPSLPEQAAIVRFLAHMDKRVQRCIRAKQKLIGLLEEQKQAIIHQAVTRGLNPDAPMKDSGVEWLGDVPEHWEVLRTKYLFKEVDKRSVTGEEQHLSMSQRLGLVPSELVERTLTSESYVGAKLCEKGDLVLNRLKAHLGVFALANQSGLISPDYSVFRKKRPMEMSFFEHVLRSSACRRELRTRAKGIVEGFWRLYTDDFFDIRVPTPPHAEQIEIERFLMKFADAISLANHRAQREIELLGEYRTRLIADVVTGKLDVREAAAKLLDESDDTEFVDELRAVDVDEDGGCSQATAGAVETVSQEELQ